MKKLLLILSVVLISASLSATTEDGDFIKTKNGTFFFKNVKVGLLMNFTGIKSNGEKIKFKASDVLGYCKNGDQYEKMPVYKDNKLTGETEFMKLVSYRNGMKLYEYEYRSKNSKKESRRYYVFKGDKFVVEMDYANRPNLTAFFDAK